MYAAKKITEANLANNLRYKCRDRSVNVKTSKRLEHQLLINNEQHEKELARTEAKLADKVVECNEVENLYHARSRGYSKTMQMADNKVAAMKD